MLFAVLVGGGNVCRTPRYGTIKELYNLNEWNVYRISVYLMCPVSLPGSV